MSQVTATAAPGAPAGPAVPAPAPPPGPGLPAAVGALHWALWRRQIAAIIRLELRKGFGGRRAFGLYLLALAPPAIFCLRLFVPHAVNDRSDIGEATVMMAQAYQSFILRVIVFLGCVLIFGNLIRREILDRSLHFYFLSPLRREILVVAKYLTGLIVSVVLFGASTLVTFILIYVPYDSRLRDRFLFDGPGLGHLGAYLLVTALACAGYGAVFLAMGFFFRSPAIPALGLFAWEAIHFLLPPVLKQLSVIHYLQALCPVPISEGPFALLSDAPSQAVSIFGLLALALLLLSVAALRIRRMEVSYLDD
jgi:ABC-type transport system involved in multi-copper enzyme maturation permease subunit